MKTIIFAIAGLAAGDDNYSDNYDRLRVGMPWAFVNAALLPFQPVLLTENNGLESYVYQGSGRLIILQFRDARLVSKFKSGK